MKATILGKFIRTQSPLVIGAWIFGVAILYGFLLYVLSSVETRSFEAIKGALEFSIFLLGGYSLIQSHYRGLELDLRKEELKRAAGAPKIIKKINQQLKRVRQDKKTGDNFLVIAFFLGIILFLMKSIFAAIN